MKENTINKSAGDKKPEIKTIKRKHNGTVVSNKMDKTLVVRVDGVFVHAVTKKRITQSKRYKVHDEKNKFQEGDKVVFAECRPISKEKRWRVIYK